MDLRFGVLGRTGRKAVAAASAFLQLVIVFINPVTAVIGSLATNFVLTDSVGLILTLSMLVIGFYELAEPIYERFDDVPYEKPLLPLLFTAVAIPVVFVFPGMGLLSLTMSYQVGDGITSFLLAATPLISVFVIGIIVFILYLASVSDDQLFGENGTFGEVIRDNNFSFVTRQQKLETDRVPQSGEKGWAGISAKIDVAVIPGVGLALPAVLAGVIGAVLSFAFPALELLVLGWVGWGVFGYMRSSFFGSSERSDGAEQSGWGSHIVDFEGRFQRELYLSISSPKGPPAVFLILTGSAGAAGYVYHGMSILYGVTAGDFAQISAANQVSTPLLVWDMVGIFLLLVVGGGYALWAWYREIHRLSAFLDCWESGRQKQTDGTGVSYPRAPGFVLFPVVFGFLAFGFSQSLATLNRLGPVDESAFIAIRLILLRFALLWPAVLLLMVAVVMWVWVRAGDHSRLYRWLQSLRYEDTVLLAGVILQLLPLTEAPGLPVTPALLTGMVVLSVALIILPDIEQYVENKRNDSIQRRYYFLIGGGLLVAAAFLPTLAEVRLMIGMGALALLANGFKSTRSVSNR